MRIAPGLPGRGDPLEHLGVDVEVRVHVVDVVVVLERVDQPQQPARRLASSISTRVVGR